MAVSRFCMLMTVFVESMIIYPILLFAEMYYSHGYHLLVAPFS